MQRTAPLLVGSFCANSSRCALKYVPQLDVANRGFKFQKRNQLFVGVHNDAVIRVYDSAGNVIVAHEHGGEFKEP